MVIFDDLFRDVQAKTSAAFGLLGREIRLEDLRQLRRLDPVTGIVHAHIHVKIFSRAGDGHGPFPFRRCLDRVDDYVLNRALYLEGIAEERARVFANIGRKFDSRFASRSIVHFSTTSRAIAETEMDLGGAASTLP